MLVQFALNTDSEIIWSLPGTNLLLTMDETEAKVDIDLLNDRQKWILAEAIHLRKLISETPAQEIFRSTQQAVQGQPTIQVAEASGFIQKDVPQSSEQLAGQAKHILKGKVVSVKKEIVVCRNIRLLKILHVLESARKKRKTVLYLLEEKMKDVEAEVTRYAMDESQALPQAMVTPFEHRIQGQTVKFDVVESEVKEVTVPILDPDATLSDEDIEYGKKVAARRRGEVEKE